MMLKFLRSTGVALCSSIGLISASSLVSAATPVQKPAASATEVPVNAIKKWDTDEAVRQGMNNIRQAIMANQDGIRNEQLRAQDYQRLADTIDKNVAAMRQNMQISKTTEKAFHLVVMMDLTQSTELMRSGLKMPLQRAGAFGVMQSLRNYGDNFQHPGWVSAS
jgi:hypothetical protein